MFQGGFVGKNCQFHVKREGAAKAEFLRDFYPADDNHAQTFDLDCEDKVTQVKIVFLDSTDFFGRITIYNLDVLGEEPNKSS